VDLTPDYDSFARAYAAGENQVVYTRLAADLDTPVSLMLKLTGAARDAFLLESVTGGEVRGRYSIIGMKPDVIWQCQGQSSRINRAARFDPDAFEDQPGDPLANLRALIAESRIKLPEDLPAASAGLFGYLGYDMIRLVEHLPDVPPDTLGLPDAVMMRPSVVAVLDGVKGEVIVVAPAWAGSGQSARAAYAQAAERVMDAVRDLDRALPQASRSLGAAREEAAPVSNFTREGYKAAVEKAREYIRAGDIFQVVPSQRWTQGFTRPPFALYRSLRRTNPSPFMFYFNFGDFQVIGASPEILVRVFGQEVTIRPVAGTRPRGATPGGGPRARGRSARRQQGVGRASDAARSGPQRCRPRGTHRHRAPDRETSPSNATAMSCISSRTWWENWHPSMTRSRRFWPVCPSGTVSGAPKVPRHRTIIDELEPEKRGVYGGGVGYFSAGGDMDVCIALRTAVVKDDKLYIQAGGGVVYDSDPEAEYMETVHKSNAIRRAATDAARFDSNGND